MPRISLSRLSIAMVAFMFVMVSCKKTNHLQDEISSKPGNGKDLSENLNAGKKIGHFAQTNLVSDVPGWANRVDPSLINGWGISWSPTGTAWISSQGGHVSDVYNRDGGTVLGPVNIPSPGGPLGGNPTGTVFNPTTGFVLSTGGPARFLFVGV
ncbi:MAG TPA: hypothetical protein VJT83_05945, partial [Chitinophagaceae bacterium]|nr:hypothetical protein [Chitinophagaceae bacterium]